MTTKKTPAKNRHWYTGADLEQRYGQVTFAKFLRSWREDEEISQAEFANCLGISRANLCDIEKGRKLVSIERAAKFARILGHSEAGLVAIALSDMLRAAKLKMRVHVTAA